MNGIGRQTLVIVQVRPALFKAVDAGHLLSATYNAFTGSLHTHTAVGFARLVAVGSIQLWRADDSCTMTLIDSRWLSLRLKVIVIVSGDGK